MKTITITLTEDRDAAPLERWTARSDFPEVEVTGSEKRAVEHGCRGACLHVLADWREVPGRIEFRSIEP